LRLIETTLCDPDYIVYISMEPNESVGNISLKFIEQFSQLILCDKNIVHRNGLTWWVGINLLHKSSKHHFSSVYALDYDRLTSIQKPNKQKRISVIISKILFFQDIISG